ncbi:30S ribosomal protein S3 [Candidatus Woesearchaeota archaeon]|nr:30S ribosomal protein S3 [Candidatus Woesearchaeota archaeon]
MIERKFISENIKEFRIKEFVADHLNRVGLSEVKLQRTPLGEKIVVSASRPGLVVGRAGANIQKLTKDLKEQFDLENPQIEIEEIKEINLDPAIVAETIASSMERFGAKQFKGSGHRSLRNVMQAGALGVEILISGKVPSQRSRTWRFYEGYLKKCGDIALTGVKVAYTTAFLKTGAVGIKVSIMPGDTKLPDRVELLKEPEVVVEETDEQSEPPAKEEKTSEEAQSTKKPSEQAPEAEGERGGST